MSLHATTCLLWLLLFLGVPSGCDAQTMTATVTGQNTTAATFTISSTIVTASPAKVYYVDPIDCSSGVDSPTCSTYNYITSAGTSTYPIEVTVTGLSPGASYSLRLNGISDNATGADPSSPTVSLCTVPLAPVLTDIVYVSNATHISIAPITTQVTAVSGFLTHYNVTGISVPSGATFTAGDSVPKDQLFHVSGLIALTAYALEVTAYNDGCGTMLASVDTFNYTACTGFSDSTTLPVYNTGTSTLLIAILGDADFHSLQAVDPNVDSGSLFDDSTTNETLSGLLFGTKYNLTISTSVGGPGGNPMCTYKTTSTVSVEQCTETKPPDDTDLIFTVTTTTISMGPFSQDGADTGGNTDGWFYQTMTPTGTVDTTEGSFNAPASFSGLSAETKYDIEFGGYITACADANSTNFTTVSVCTSPLDANIAPGALEVTANSVTFEWADLSASNATGANYSDVPGSSPVETSNVIKTFGGLSPATEYTIDVVLLFQPTGCSNKAESENVFTAKFCTDFDAAPTLSGTATQTSIDVSMDGTLGNTNTVTVNAITKTYDDTAVSFSPLTPATEYTISGTSAMSGVNCTHSGDSTATVADVVVCTLPVAPDFTGVPATSDDSSITVQGSATAVTAPGSANKYQFSHAVTAGANDTTATTTGDVVLAADLDVTGLSSATTYTLYFQSVFSTCTPGSVDSGSDTGSIVACTSPSDPTVESSISVDSSTINVDFADITGEFTDFKVVSVTLGGTPEGAATITPTAYQSSGSVAISGLSTAGGSYSVQIQTAHADASCINSPAEGNVISFSACTTPPVPVPALSTGNATAITLDSIGAAIAATTNYDTLSAISGTASASAVGGTLAGLSPGTEHTVNVTITKSTGCDKNGVPAELSSSGTGTACTEPLPPVYTNILSAKSFAATTTALTIKGSNTSIESGGGGLDNYVFDSVDPALVGVTAAPSAAAVNADMAISDLATGTMYSIKFKGQITSCSGVDSSTTSTLANLCTEPAAPDVTAATAAVNTTSIAISGVTATNKFVASAITPTITPALSAAETTTYSISSGLTAGTKYSITLNSVFDEDGGTPCANGAVQSTATSSVDVCTTPVAPTVTEDSTARTDSQVTLSGVAVSAGGFDTFSYSISPNPTGGPVSATGQTTTPVNIGSLDAGTEYNASVKVEIGSVTGCGLSTTQESEETAEPVCTLPDVPVMSSTPVTAVNTTHIEVDGTTTAVTVAVGSIDSYDLDATSSGTASSAAKDAKMTITFAPGNEGTSQSLVFKTIASLCGSDLESTSTTTLSNICLKPEAPSVTTVTPAQTTVTIAGSDIGLSSNWDKFFVDSITPDFSPPFSNTGSKTSLEDYLVSGLTAGLNYSVDLKTQVGGAAAATTCLDSAGSPVTVESEAQTISFCTNPDTPTISFSTSNHTAVALDSISTTDWDKFDVEAVPALSSPVTDKLVADLGLDIPNLTPGTVYNFTVTVKLGVAGGTDCGEGGEVTTAVSGFGCTKPDGPDMSDVVMSSTDNNTVTVTPTASVLPGTTGTLIDNYAFVSTNDTSNPGSNTDGNVTVTTALTISDLQPGRVYDLTFVGQYTDASCGADPVQGTETGTVASVCTRPASPDITSADALTATNTSITAVYASLPATEGIYDNLKVVSISPDASPAFAGSTSASDITVTGLTPGTPYDLTLETTLGDTFACHSAVNLLSEQVVISGCTAPPDPVLSADGISGSAIQVSINATATNTTQFDKYKVSIDDATSSESGFLDPADIHNFTGLDAGTEYTITVTLYKGFTAGSCGLMSNLTSTGTVNACTWPKPPDVSSVTQTASNTSSVTISGSPSNVLDTDGSAVGGYDVLSAYWDNSGTNIPIMISTDATNYALPTADLVVSGFTSPGVPHFLGVVSYTIAGTCADDTQPSEEEELEVCLMPNPPDNTATFSASATAGGLIVQGMSVNTGGSYSVFDLTFVPEVDKLGNNCTNTGNVTKSDVNSTSFEMLGLEPGCAFKLFYKASCVTSDGSSKQESDATENTESYCSKPGIGVKTVTARAAGENTIALYNLAQTNGSYTYFDLIFDPDPVKCELAPSRVKENLASVNVTSEANLAPGCPYNVSYNLKCVTAAGDAVASDSVTLPTPVCTQPTNMQEGGMTMGSNESSLWFQNVGVVDGYAQGFIYKINGTVALYNGDLACDEYVGQNFTFSGANDTQVIENLSPGCEYTFQISARCEDEVGPERDFSICTYPSTITNLAQDKDASDHTTVTVEWNYNSSWPKIEFLLEVNGTANDTIKNTTGTPTAGNHLYWPTISDLVSTTSYVLNVVPTKQCSNGDALTTNTSGGITIFTGPVAPTIEAFVLSDTSVLLQYRLDAADEGKMPNATITLYNNGTEIASGYPTTTLDDFAFHTLGGLDGATIYRVGIEAEWNGVRTLMNETFVDFCTKPSEPQNCEVIQIDKNTHQVGCDAPSSGDPDQYRVQFINGTWLNFTTLPQNFTDLSPGSAYFYSIKSEITCSVDSSTLLSAAATTGTYYTHPDEPMVTSITATTDSLTFQLNKNNPTVGLPNFQMQLWTQDACKTATDDKCLFPYQNAAGTWLYELTSDDQCATEVNATTGVSSATGTNTGSPCKKLCSTASGSTCATQTYVESVPGLSASRSNLIDGRVQYTCTGYDSTSIADPVSLTAIDGSGTCQDLNTSAEVNCDTTSCAAVAVSQNYLAESLTPGAQYFVRLYLIHQGIVSGPTLDTACTKPMKPESISYLGQDTFDTQITITWEAPSSGNCDGYFLNIPDLSVSDSNVTNVDGVTREYVVSAGVEAETCYTVSLQCYIVCYALQRNPTTEIFGPLAFETVCSGPVPPNVTAFPLSNETMSVSIAGLYSIIYEDYLLEHSTDNLTFTNVTGASHENDVDSLDSAVTHYFRAKVKRHGVWSSFSEVVATCTFPTAVSDVSVSACSKNAITVAWPATSSPVTSYFARNVGIQDWVDTSGSLSQAFTGLSPARSYTFEARASFACTADSQTYYSTVVGTSPYTGPPDATFTLSHSAAAAKDITIQFTNYEAKLGVNIERNGSLIAQGLTSSTYKDTSGDFSTSYSYTAYYNFSLAGICEDGAETSDTICTFPGKVQNLNHVVINSTWTNITWDAPSSGTVTEYKWYIVSDTKTSVGTDTFVVLTDLNPSETYVVNVYASYDCPDGSTLEGSVSSVLVKTMPGSVSLTTESLSSTEIQIIVNTTEDVTNITLFRNTTGGSETLIGSSLEAGDTVRDTGRTPGTQYFYTAVAYYEGVMGDESTVASDCTQPAIPTNLVVTNSTVDSIIISYDISNGGVTSAMAKYIGGTYGAADSTSDHVFTGLSPSSTYTLLVKSQFDCPLPSTTYESAPSTGITGNTYPLAPTVNSVTSISTTELQVSFVRLGAHTYSLSTDGAAAVSVTTSGTKVTVGSLSPGTSYSFTMYATRQGLTSEASAALEECTYQLPPANFTYTLLNGVTAQLTWEDDVNTGSFDNYIVDSLTTSEVSVASSENTLNVSLTELALDTYFIHSQQTCSSSGTALNSSKVFLEVQAGVADLKMSMNGRTSDDSIEFTATPISSLLSYKFYSENDGLVANLTSSEVPYDYDFGGCAVEDCVLYEALLGNWAINASNGPICECSKPCGVTGFNATVYHPDRVMIEFHTANKLAVTYEYRHSANSTWIDIGNDTEHNITDLPPATPIDIEIRATFTCPATSEVLKSDISVVSVATGPSPGSITSFETVNYQGDPGRLQIKFESAPGESSANMRYTLYCRTMGFFNDTFSNYSVVEDDLSDLDSPYLMRNLNESTMYHCAISTKLNGFTSDNFDQEFFACTRPSAPIDMQVLDYGPSSIEYEWDHEDPTTDENGSALLSNTTCFQVWYENYPKEDNGVSREKTFSSLPQPISPYLLSARAYQVCAVDTTTWTRYRDCLNVTDNTGVTFGSTGDGTLYSDFTQITGWTGPSNPVINSANLSDCSSVAVTMESFNAENGVVYNLRRDGVSIMEDPYQVFVDRDLEYGRNYNYSMSATLYLADQGVTLTSYSGAISVCTCPPAPSRVTKVSPDPYSVNLTWSESIDTETQPWLFDNRFAYWYEIGYNFTNGTVISPRQNTSGNSSEEITGLPGPSTAIDVSLVTVLDCANHQGPITSYNDLPVAAYTRPFALALDAANSGCLSDTAISHCALLNGNVDPEFIHFYFQGSLTYYYTSNDYAQLCAEKTALTPGTPYNFTTTASKYQLEGAKHAYFQLCTCPGLAEDVGIIGISETELSVYWSAPSEGDFDLYHYKRDTEATVDVEKAVASVVHGNLTAGTIYILNVTIWTNYTCERSDGQETLISPPKSIELIGCTQPAPPKVNATYLGKTRIELNFSQPIGSVDYYILTSSPPLNDPKLGLIGDTVEEGKRIGTENLELMNLEKYRAYTFRAYPVFCNLVGTGNHRVARIEKPAAALKMMGVRPWAAMLVFFGAGASVTAIFFVVLYAAFKFVFAPKPPPAGTTSATAQAPPADPEPEIPPNWRINNAYEQRADYNAIRIGKLN